MYFQRTDPVAESDLREFPSWAVAAIAVRCALRVQPLIWPQFLSSVANSNETKQYLVAIATALDSAIGAVAKAADVHDEILAGSGVVVEGQSGLAAASEVLRPVVTGATNAASRASKAVARMGRLVGLAHTIASEYGDRAGEGHDVNVPAFHAIHAAVQSAMNALHSSAAAANKAIYDKDEDGSWNSPSYELAEAQSATTLSVVAAIDAACNACGGAEIGRDQLDAAVRADLAMIEKLGIDLEPRVTGPSCRNQIEVILGKMPLWEEVNSGPLEYYLEQWSEGFSRLDAETSDRALTGIVDRYRQLLDGGGYDFEAARSRVSKWNADDRETSREAGDEQALPLDEMCAILAREEWNLTGEHSDLEWLTNAFRVAEVWVQWYVCVACCLLTDLEYPPNQVIESLPEEVRIKGSLTFGGWINAGRMIRKEVIKASKSNLSTNDFGKSLRETFLKINQKQWESSTETLVSIRNKHAHAKSLISSSERRKLRSHFSAALNVLRTTLLPIANQQIMYLGRVDRGRQNLKVHRVLLNGINPHPRGQRVDFARDAIEGTLVVNEVYMHVNRSCWLSLHPWMIWQDDTPRIFDGISKKDGASTYRTPFGIPS